jgi:hypothetical protein
VPVRVVGQSTCRRSAALKLARELLFSSAPRPMAVLLSPDSVEEHRIEADGGVSACGVAGRVHPTPTAGAVIAGGVVLQAPRRRWPCCCRPWSWSSQRTRERRCHSWRSRKANGVPPRLKLVAALTAPFTSSVAAGAVVPMPIPDRTLETCIEFPSLVALNHNGT